MKRLTNINLNNGNSLTEFLNTLSAMFSIYNSYLNNKQISNDAIMRELEKQDRKYLEKILEKLEKLEEQEKKE